MRLVTPGVVPIRILIYLARAGVTTTAEVHRHIQGKTLKVLPGIGPKREREVLHYYTA